MMCVDWHSISTSVLSLSLLVLLFLLQLTKSLLQLGTLLKYTHLHAMTRKALAHIQTHSLAHSGWHMGPVPMATPLDPRASDKAFVKQAPMPNQGEEGRRRYTHKSSLHVLLPSNLSTNDLFVIACFHGIISPITIWGMGNPSHSWGFGLSTWKHACGSLDYFKTRTKAK